MYCILGRLSSPIMIGKEQRGRNVRHIGRLVVANNDRKDQRGRNVGHTGRLVVANNDKRQAASRIRLDHSHRLQKLRGWMDDPLIWRRVSLNKKLLEVNSDCLGVVSWLGGSSAVAGHNL